MCGIRQGCGRHLLMFTSALCQISLTQLIWRWQAARLTVNRTRSFVTTHTADCFLLVMKAKRNLKNMQSLSPLSYFFRFHFLYVISYVILLFWKWWHTATCSGSKTATRYLCSFTEIILIISLWNILSPLIKVNRHEKPWHLWHSKLATENKTAVYSLNRWNKRLWIFSSRRRDKCLGI